MSFSRGKATVLVVDDEEFVRAPLVRWMTEGGLGVLEAADAAAARELLARGGVDLVLLDLRLPDGDGLELARELRAEGSPCRIVLMGGDLPSSPRGVDACLRKPFRLDELDGTLTDLLGPPARGG